jgi:hypothetical protein
VNSKPYFTAEDAEGSNTFEKRETDLYLDIHRKPFSDQILS